MEGFLMYVACPIDNPAPKAFFTRAAQRHALLENSLNFGSSEMASP